LVVFKELVKANNQSGSIHGFRRCADVHKWAREQFPEIAKMCRTKEELICELMDWAHVNAILACMDEGIVTGCPGPPNAK
jgi:hypothetical protein